MSDRWNEALEAAAKAVAKLAGDAWDKYKRGHGPERANPHWQGVADGLEDAHEAILALREVDQRGAQQVSTDPLNATANPQSAPPHPGGREEMYRSLLVSMLSAQDDVRAYLESIMPEGAVDDIMLPMDACADVVKALLSASAKVDPGVQEKAAPTALASSDPEGHLQAMSDAELPASASSGPDYEALIAGRLRSIHAELLAAAEEERGRG